MKTRIQKTLLTESKTKNAGLSFSKSGALALLPASCATFSKSLRSLCPPLQHLPPGVTVRIQLVSAILQ